MSLNSLPTPIRSQKNKKKEKKPERTEKVKSAPSLGCPPDLLRIVQEQTRLGEGTIHKKYLQFKQKYPSVYVREKQFYDCIIEKYLDIVRPKFDEKVLVQLEEELRNDENIKIKVDKMFKLFQETKRDGGWSSFLGFKEVMLATENLSSLGTLSGQLRWIFRLHDWDGDGKVDVGLLPRILRALLEFRTELSPQASLYISDMVDTAMSGYEMSMYNENSWMITEEEFVYDSHINIKLSQVIKKLSSILEENKLK